jgi:hypothetical protein
MRISGSWSFWTGIFAATLVTAAAPLFPVGAQGLGDARVGVSTDGAAASRRVARHLTRLALEITAPELQAPLLSLIPCTLPVGTTYTGSGVVTYSLVQAPDGMTIDADTGILTWIPPFSMEGQQATVEVSATDGALIADVSFAVQVAKTQPVTTALVGSTITVTQSGSLKELSFAFPTGTSIPLDQVKVSQLTTGQVAPPPAWITRLSDFFRVTPTFGLDGMITIAMSAASLPAGRQSRDLRLYIFTDGIQDAEFGCDVSGSAWVRTWYSLDVLPNGKVTVKLQSVGSVSFIGVEAPVVPPSSVNGLLTLRFRPLSVPKSCVGALMTDGGIDPNRQVCTAEYTPGKTLVAIVKNIGDLHLTPPASLDDVVDWLAAGRRKFEGYGLKSDDSFEIDIGPMPDGVLGFVTTEKNEDRRVLHITNGPIWRNLVQGSVVHEYFHHAQSRTTEKNTMTLITFGSRSKWLIEGLARWFEDEVFDDSNTYASKEEPPGPAILERGLNAIPEFTFDHVKEAMVEGDPRTRSYARFAFWKMVSRFCPGFSIPDILNVSDPKDLSGIANFKSRIEAPATAESPGWGCDFSAVMATPAKLAQALVYYSVATTDGGGDMTKLDGNEPPYAFETTHTPISPPPCDVLEACPSYSFDSPPASAVSIKIAGTSNLDRQVVFTQVRPIPDGTVLWVQNTRFGWAWDHEPLDHDQWIPTTSNAIYYNHDDTQSPEEIVSVVNADASIAGKFSLRTGIITPRITVQAVTCSYVGPYGPPQDKTSLYRFSARGTASGVPGVSYLVLEGGQFQETTENLTCASWNGGFQHEQCGSRTGNPIMTNWTLDSTLVASGPPYTPQYQLSVYSRWDPPFGHLFDTKPLAVTCTSGN